jgi:alkanesulfonate monooxygenase SsuD/methylene tetrahydromethanopterin reductase-like flavin-dependent oxidoreductase (luciferase family)
VKFGCIVTTGSPREAAELAAIGEAAGWDGIFTWDGIAIGEVDTWDPWVVMGAMAMTTERVTLGAIVTPPARRRPWKLAREALTVDHLSGGRLVVPVGLGALDDLAFGNVGEPTDAQTRAERLDESLAILDGLWSGEPFGFEGRHYRFGPMTFRPRPIARPRIPMWVVGAWPNERSMRRAIRWDGVVTQVPDAGAVADVAAWVARERAVAGATGAYQIVVQGVTPPDPGLAAAIVAPYAAAGGTWWLDGDWQGATVGSLRARLEAGPPPLGETGTPGSEAGPARRS